ncbi:MAG: ABC transporter ATP-binding protein [Malacoplasma sp.]|nr:ABC transporter ATP-binding protein [Malacoplasma sp.]
MVNIHKSFLNGAIKANVGINLFVKKNSIHAIIGENGAGKSTLMSILFGMYSQDIGEIYINSQKINFKSSKDASAYKIGMVHQHFKLVENFSVFDNIILGSERSNSIGFMQKNDDRKKVANLIKKYKFNLDLDQKVSQLSVGQQQKIEILKVLFRDSEIIIFDEPTAVLSDVEIVAFLEIVKQFQKDGKTIIIISHKLNEIKSVASEATIIRKGKFVATIDVSKTSVEKMAEFMVGRKVVESINAALPYDNENTQDKVILEVNNLDLNYEPPIEKAFKEGEKKIKSFTYNLVASIKGKNVNNEVQNTSLEKKLVSFKIHAGEIYAIAGIEGNGQSEVIEYISGLKKANPDSIIFNGENISKLNIKKRINAGISHVPEDRHKYGLDLEDDCRLNMAGNQIDKKPFSTSGFLVDYQIADYSNDIITKYDVRGSANGTATAKSLSGGNQQKVIVGREMQKDHQLIILAQPTRGLDIGAIQFIHNEIIKEKQKGNAILLVSYELDEILALADTIAVMSRKRIIAQGNKVQMTRSTIGNLLAKEEA